MDYKKKYEEALEKARKFIEANPLVQNLNTWLKETFPELQVSEDERIRKWLLDFVQGLPDEGLDFHFYNLTKEEVLAWLEKQKPVIAESEKWLIDETLYFLDEFQQSNRYCSENELQNSVSCMDWLKSLKQRMGG